MWGKLGMEGEWAFLSWAFLESKEYFEFVQHVCPFRLGIKIC